MNTKAETGPLYTTPINLDLVRDPQEAALAKRLEAIQAAYKVNEGHHNKIQQIALNLLGWHSFALSYKDVPAASPDIAPQSLAESLQTSFTGAVSEARSFFDLSEYVSTGIEHTQIYKAAAVNFNVARNHFNNANVDGINFQQALLKIEAEQALELANIIYREQAAIGVKIAQKPAEKPQIELGIWDQIQLFFTALNHYLFNSTNTKNFGDLWTHLSEARLKELNPKTETELPWDQQVEDEKASRIALSDALLSDRVVSEIKDKTGLDMTQSIARFITKVERIDEGVVRVAAISSPIDALSSRAMNEGLYTEYKKTHPSIAATYEAEMQKNGIEDPLLVAGTGAAMGLVGLKTAGMVAKPALGIAKATTKLATGLGLRAGQSIFGTVGRFATRTPILGAAAGYFIYATHYEPLIEEFRLKGNPLSAAQEDILMKAAWILALDPTAIVDEKGFVASQIISGFSADDRHLIETVYGFEPNEFETKVAAKEQEIARIMEVNSTVMRLADHRGGAENFIVNKTASPVYVAHESYAALEKVLSAYLESGNQHATSAHNGLIQTLEKQYQSERAALEKTYRYKATIDILNVNPLMYTPREEVDAAVNKYIKDNPLTFTGETAHLSDFNAYLTHVRDKISVYHASGLTFQNAEAVKNKTTREDGSLKSREEITAANEHFHKAKAAYYAAQEALTHVVDLKSLESGYQTVFHTLLEINPEVRGPAYEMLRHISLMNGQSSLEWSQSLQAFQGTLALRAQPLQQGLNNIIPDTTLTHLSGTEFSKSDNNAKLYYIPMADQASIKRFEERRAAEEILLTQFKLYQRDVVDSYIRAQFEIPLAANPATSVEDVMAKLSLEQLRLAVITMPNGTPKGTDTPFNNDRFIAWLSERGQFEIFVDDLTQSIRIEADRFSPEDNYLKLNHFSEDAFSDVRASLSEAGTLSASELAKRSRDLIQSYLKEVVQSEASRAEFISSFNYSSAPFVETLKALSRYGHTESAQIMTVKAIQDMFILAADGIDINQIDSTLRPMVEAAREAKASYEKHFSGVAASDIQSTIDSSRQAFFTDPKGGFLAYFNEYVKQSGASEKIIREIENAPPLKVEEGIMAVIRINDANKDKRHSAATIHELPPEALLAMLDGTKLAGVSMGELPTRNEAHSKVTQVTLQVADADSTSHRFIPPSAIAGAQITLSQTAAVV